MLPNRKVFGLKRLKDIMMGALLLPLGMLVAAVLGCVYYTTCVLPYQMPDIKWRRHAPSKD